MSEQEQKPRSGVFMCMPCVKDFKAAAANERFLELGGTIKNVRFSVEREIAAARSLMKEIPCSN